MSYLIGKMLLCLFLAALIGLIVGWLLRRFGAVKRELELTGEIEVRNDRVGSLEGQLGERDTKIMSLGSDLELWQSKVPGLESTIAARDDQVMGLTMDLDTWKQKLPPLEARLSEVDAERTQLSTDLADQAKQLADREEHIGQLTAEVSTLRKQIADVNERSAKEAADFNAELTGQKQHLDTVRSELESTSSALLLEKDVAAAMTTKVSALQGEMDALKLHSDAQTKEAREREQALTELRQTLKTQDAERMSLAEQVTTLSPVALRVTSQDQSIASLNQDLRTRDTTIKALQDQLAETRNQAEELKSSEQSLGLLRTELDGLRGELSAARSAVTAASQSTDQVAAEIQAKAAGTEKEWRTRLRIADSGRAQAQADLYRRQEQIERLQRQLTAAQAEASAQKLKAQTAANAPPEVGSAAQGLFGMAGTVAAGTVAATDERQWKSQLRIAESSRRKAEADAQRQSERVTSLEARLRAVNNPVSVLPDATSAPAPATAPTPLSAPVPPAASPTNTGSALATDRFLTSIPKDQDDLQKIKGVGKVLKKTLNSLGIYQFRQVALFSADDIAWVDDRLKFKGRIERDEWVSQAVVLHRAKYGSDPKAS